MVIELWALVAAFTRVVNKIFHSQFTSQMPGTRVPGRLTHLLGPTVHGSRNRKKLAGVVALTGMAFEKAPVPSNVPVLFVIQAIGADRLVVLSQV